MHQALFWMLIIFVACEVSCLQFGPLIRNSTNRASEFTKYALEIDANDLGEAWFYRVRIVPSND